MTIENTKDSQDKKELHIQWTSKTGKCKLYELAKNWKRRKSCLPTTTYLASVVAAHFPIWAL